MIYMLLFLLNILLRNGSKICKKYVNGPERQPGSSPAPLKQVSQAAEPGRGRTCHKGSPSQQGAPSR